jgi:hypothetical protein
MRRFWEEGWHKERYVPLCVLCELGRIEDDAEFWDAAWWYGFYARDLTAKQAAAKIRQMRTGNAPHEGPVTLYRQLMRAIEDFQILYPDASLLYVEGQVKHVLKTVRGFRQHRS